MRLSPCGEPSVSSNEPPSLTFCCAALPPTFCAAIFAAIGLFIIAVSKPDAVADPESAIIASDKTPSGLRGPRNCFPPPDATSAEIVWFKYFHGGNDIPVDRAAAFSALCRATA